MDFNFTVKRSGDVNMFKNTINALKDFRPAFKNVKSMQLKEINEAFNVSGKNITGEPWQKLKPNYLKQKIASGFLTNILVRTGKLRKSFKSIRLSKTILQITSVGIPYFKNHQLGKEGSTFKARIPRRQILGHSNKMIKTTLKIFTDFIIKKIKHG